MAKPNRNRREHRLHVALNHDELIHLDALCDAAGGHTRSAIVRATLNLAELPNRPGHHQIDRAAIAALNRIGVNLNRLAKFVNSTTTLPHSRQVALAAALTQLRDQIADMIRKIQHEKRGYDHE